MDNLKKIIFKDTLSIVIPLHNKESNIAFTVKSLIENIHASNLQIVIVENESTDSSKYIAEKIVKQYKHKIDISLYESEKGLGAALIEGFKHCKNSWIYFTPADFSFGISDISYVEKNNLYDKYDVFLGSKSHKDSLISRSRSRTIYSLIFNSILKIFFKIPFQDTQGTLIFKSRILKDIKKLQNKKFLISTEFVVKCSQADKKILEIPVVDFGIDTVSTVQPFRDGLNMIFNLIKLRVNINR